MSSEVLNFSPYDSFLIWSFSKINLLITAVKCNYSTYSRFLLLLLNSKINSVEGNYHNNNSARIFWSAWYNNVLRSASFHINQSFTNLPACSLRPSRSNLKDNIFFFLTGAGRGDVLVLISIFGFNKSIK